MLFTLVLFTLVLFTLVLFTLVPLAAMRMGVPDLVEHAAGQGEVERGREEKAPLDARAQGLSPNHAGHGQGRVHERKLVGVKLGQTAKVRKKTARGDVYRQRRRLHGRLFDFDTLSGAGNERVRPGIGVDLGRQSELHRPHVELSVGVGPTLEGRVDGQADGRVQDRRAFLNRLHRLLHRLHTVRPGLLPLEILDALHQVTHFPLHLAQLLLERIHRLLCPDRDREPPHKQNRSASENQPLHFDTSHGTSFWHRCQLMLLINYYQNIKGTLLPSPFRGNGSATSESNRSLRWPFGHIRDPSRRRMPRPGGALTTLPDLSAMSRASATDPAALRAIQVWYCVI